MRGATGSREAGKVFLGALLFAGACEGAARSPQPQQSPAPPAVVAQPMAAAEPPPLPAAKEPRGLRVRVLDAAKLTSANVESVGQLLQVGDAPATIDLEDGSRVRAAAHSRLCAFASAKSLLLVSGELQLTRLPDASRDDGGPVRIASLVGAFEPGPSAEVMLRAEASAGTPVAYRAQLSLTRGAATWFTVGSDPLQLIAGEPLPKPVAGLHWSAANEAPRTREQRFVALRMVSSDADLDQLLDVALTEQAALRERGHALLAPVSARHAALAKAEEAQPPPQQGSTRDYQRALVAHAQRRQAQAAQLLLAAERSLLQALAACAAAEPHTCASLQAWSTRFAARAARLL